MSFKLFIFELDSLFAYTTSFNEASNSCMNMVSSNTTKCSGREDLTSIEDIAFTMSTLQASVLQKKLFVRAEARHRGVSQEEDDGGDEGYRLRCDSEWERGMFTFIWAPWPRPYRVTVTRAPHVQYSRPQAHIVVVQLVSLIGYNAALYSTLFTTLPRAVVPKTVSNDYPAPA